MFHLLLLLVLATITLHAGGGGFGFHLRPKGARVTLTLRNQMIEDASLEDMIETMEVKPLQVQHVTVARAELPKLSSLSVPRPHPQRLSHVNTRFSPASGAVGSLSGQFGTFIAGLRKSGLDIVLVIDATASMQHVINDIKQTSLALVTRIQSLVPIARVGVVAFRDKGEEFVVRWTDLSFHASKIQAFINNLGASGGGDWEEGVRQGVEAAIDELSWRRRAKRVIIVVGSSPPHHEDQKALEALAAEFHDMGGVISTIDVTERMHEEYERQLHLWLYGTPAKKISPLPTFYEQVRSAYRGIATNGGGEMAALGSEQELAEQILTFAFGSRWQKEVARYSSEQITDKKESR